MHRVVRRTVRRVVTRQRLWNNNREPISNLYRLDPDKSIIAWTWLMHADYIRRYTAAMQDPAFEYLDFVRLRSERDIAEFLMRDQH